LDYQKLETGACHYGRKTLNAQRKKKTEKERKSTLKGKEADSPEGRVQKNGPLAKVERRPRGKRNIAEAGRMAGRGEYDESAVKREGAAQLKFNYGGRTQTGKTWRPGS